MLFVKTLSNLLWYTAYPVSLLPLRALYIVSDCVYFVGYYIVGYRNSIIVQNLSRSFPEKKYGEIKVISKGFTHHFFNICAEWVKLVSSSNKNLNKRIKFKNIELLKHYSYTGENVILVMGHFGNWEYLNLLPNYVQQPVYAVYKQLSNPVIDNVSARLRTRFGVRLLESREASKFVLMNRTHPSFYIFIADQSPPSQSRDCYLFLNQPTKVFSGVEKLAKATDSAVVYVEIMPSKRGSYTISFKAITSHESVTPIFLNELEQTIIHSPSHWLWSHRRWKHCAELEPLNS